MSTREEIQEPICDRGPQCWNYIQKMKIKYALKKYLEEILKDEIPKGYFIEIESLTADSIAKTGTFSFSIYEYPPDTPLDVDNSFGV